MDIKQWKNLIIIKNDNDESITGYHPDRFELARLDYTDWDSIAQLTPEMSESLLTELNEWNSEAPIVTTNTNEFNGEVDIFSINLSQVCNLKCTYCGAGGDGTYSKNSSPRIQLNIVNEQILNLVKKLKKGSQFRLQILGGEPLLYFNDLENLVHSTNLISKDHDVEILYSVITNGTLLNNKVCNFLAENHFQVTISWDGPEEVQNKFRPALTKKNSSYNLVLEGVQNLIKYRDNLNGLHVNSVMGKHNTEVLKSYDLLKQYNFDYYNFGFAAEDGDEAASEIYLKEMERLAHTVYKSGGLQQLSKILPFGRFLEILSSNQAVENFCQAGKRFLHSDTNGRIYACNWFSGDQAEKIGEFTTIDTESRKSWLSPLVWRHNCQSCWAKHLCGGGCASVFKTKSGKSDQKDPSFCRRVRSLAGMSIYYYSLTLAETNSDSKEVSNETH